MQQITQPPQKMVFWKAQKTGNKYPVLLSCAGANDICNIMQEDIQTTSLDWLCPSLDFFVKDAPQIRMATLRCTHKFYIGAILYHFKKNQMRCPVCREGEDNTINAKAIPQHMREKFIQRCNETKTQEAQEENDEEQQQSMQTIHEIIREEILDVLWSYRPRTPVYNFQSASFTLTYDTHSNENCLPDGFETETNTAIPLRSIQNNNLEFIVARSHLRALSRYIQNTCPSAITLHICCNDNIVCSTRPINIPILHPTHQQLNAANSANFTMVTDDDETVSLVTQTIHFIQTETHNECVFRGNLHLELSQTIEREDACFPVYSMRWVPNITELTHVIVHSITQ